VRAIIRRGDKVLIVNAYPGQVSDLWCLPGGGVERGASLPDNLIREVFEETGLAISVGAPCLVNEFHDPDTGFHQVEVFFYATVRGPSEIGTWADVDGVVNRHQWVTGAELSALRVKPDSLRDVVFDGAQGLRYDPLERVVK